MSPTPTPTPTLYDQLLHVLSLQIAATYHQMILSRLEDEALQDIILAYRSIRRHIGKDKDGKRFGANDAHRIMQGGV